MVVLLMMVVVVMMTVKAMTADDQMISAIFKDVFILHPYLNKKDSGNLSRLHLRHADHNAHTVTALAI